MARAAIPYVRRALAAPRADVRVTGAQAVALLGDRALLPDLERAVRDAEVTVRIAALEALHDFGDLAAPFGPIARERLAAAENADEAAAAASLLANLVADSGDEIAGS